MVTDGHVLLWKFCGSRYSDYVDPYIQDAMVRWTVRVAVACYLGRVSLDIGSCAGSRRPDRMSRWCWTLGCGCYLLHVTFAFAFVHDWSNALAYQATAQQTLEQTGIEWGGGLYLNYAFSALWLVDVVAWWWRGAETHYRSKVYYWTVQGIFAFMVFNATVVFGPTFWRWAAAAAALAWSIVYWRRR